MVSQSQKIPSDYRTYENTSKIQKNIFSWAFWIYFHFINHTSNAMSRKAMIAKKSCPNRFFKKQYRRFHYILVRWLTSSRPTKTFLSHINQIRIHCSYQKIHVFYLKPNFSLQLYSFYGCIAHFVSDLVLNPEYRFSRAVAHIKPYWKSIKNTCTLIHNPRLFILCKVFAPKHVHKLTLLDCRTCIWYMPEWLCESAMLNQQFVYVCDKCSNLGQVKKQKIRNLIYTL